MTRGEVAEAADVTAETVRYYEERGLIPAPRRSAAGYRLYGPAFVERIRFIKRAQELGFTLSETEGLLAVGLVLAAMQVVWVCGLGSGWLICRLCRFQRRRRWTACLRLLHYFPREP